MDRRSFLTMIIAATWLPQSLRDIAWDVRKRMEPKPVPDCWTERDGDWNDPATWFEGRIPVDGDVVIVRHEVFTGSGTAFMSHLILESTAEVTFAGNFDTDSILQG